MPAGARRVDGPVLALAVVLLVPVSGCAELVDTGSDEDTDTASPPGEAPVEDCLSQTFRRNESRDAPRSAWIECEANVPGTTEQAMRCGEPGGAEARVEANLTAGRVTVRVLDAEDSVVAEATVADTGGQVREIPVDGENAVAGEWTLVGDRREGFDGTYRAELYCPSG